MAVKTIPDGVLLQPETLEAKKTSGETHSESYKGVYAVLKTFKDGISLGDDTVGGQHVLSASLRRAPGDLGVLTLELGTMSSDASGNLKAERAVWSCKSVRNDHSLIAYCGSDNNNPNRAWIECWQSERDADLAVPGNYRKDDGTVAKLIDQPFASPTLALIGKFQKGIESVVRFYPVLTCKATYSSIPSTFFENLGYVDTPAARAANEVKAPGNLSSIINAYNWLKVQDDVDELPDGKFQRTESWMGSENEWDRDLYGTGDDKSRWTMPYNGKGV